uniref:Uncharacterized protein n=1 Tax=Arundo donax TaxID=35708 RepID=A0A0A9G3L1_ARUDO
MCKLFQRAFLKFNRFCSSTSCSCKIMLLKFSK